MDSRILILDSHTASQQMLITAIQRLGYTVEYTHSPLAVQAAITAWPRFILIVVVDTAQPETIEHLTDLRAQWPDGLIVGSGAHTLETALAAWHAGANDYLAWPSQDAELGTLLERVGGVGKESDIHPAVPLEIEALQQKLLQLTQIYTQTMEMIHKINNFLTPILGMADLLLDELPDDHFGREYAQSIQASAIRIRDLARTFVMASSPNE